MRSFSLSLRCAIAFLLVAMTACSDGDASRACETNVNCFVGEICYAGFCSPDPGTPDAGADSNEPDTDDRDTEEPDAAEPDAAEPDAAEPDAAEPDAEEPDAEEPDAEEPDAEEPDAEEPDAEEPDAEEPIDDDLYFIEVTWSNPSWSEGDPDLDVDLIYCLDGAVEFETLQAIDFCVNYRKESDTWLIDGSALAVELTQQAGRPPGPERVEHRGIDADTTTYLGVHSFDDAGLHDLTATLRIGRGDTTLFERQRALVGHDAVWFAAQISWSADGPPTITEGPACTVNCVSEGLYSMPVPLP